MGFPSSNCSSAQAAKRPPPHCSWSRARFTKPGLGWQCLVKAKGEDRSESLDLVLPRSLLGCGSPKEGGPYLESQSQWLRECRCRL